MMQPPDRGTAALYIKCPACGVWELHVAGTEQVIADTLGNPKLKGWGCTACGHWWDIVPVCPAWSERPIAINIESTLRGGPPEAAPPSAETSGPTGSIVHRSD